MQRPRHLPQRGGPRLPTHATGAARKQMNKIRTTNNANGPTAAARPPNSWRAHKRGKHSVAQRGPLHED
eukprot:307358-Lingulodinium_polyedra.AAC.1